MVIANLTESVRAKFGIYVAQISAVEKRAAFIFPKAEMACAVSFGDYIFAKASAKVSFYSFVHLKGIAVNIYLPADTAAVAAFVGNTAEIFIIIGYNCNHLFLSLFSKFRRQAVVAHAFQCVVNGLSALQYKQF